MSDRRPEHAPKVAALRAEAAGLLSGAGRERLLRHVAECEVCAEHLKGARRFHALVSRATGQPALDEGGAVQRVIARNRLVQRRARVQWGGLAVAAGVLLAVLLASRHDEQRDERAKREPPVRAPAAAPQVISELLAVAVTALRGEVHVIEPAHAARVLGIDDAVREHSVLRVGESASVDLALGEAASVHLGADAEVALDAVRTDHVALRLSRGVISNAVEKRAEGQSYEILAAGHRVAVRGTRFAVRVGPGGLGVQCDEGAVEVIAPSGETTLLRAPATWQERVLTPAGAQPEPKLEVAAPYARRDGSVLTLPSVEGIEGWEIAGQVYPAGGVLRMRVPPGGHELVALLGGGKRHVVKVEVDAIGTQVRPSDLAFAKVPDPPAPAAPAAAEPAEGVDASSVILAGRPALQRCYERSLKNESSGSHALRLSISIDPRGRVRKVEPSSQRPGVELPAELSQCIRTAVQGWRFPAPGEDGLTLEAPLRFQLRR